MAERKRIAAVLTWYIPGSHSDVLVGKFLPGPSVEPPEQPICRSIVHLAAIHAPPAPPVVMGEGAADW